VTPNPLLTLFTDDFSTADTSRWTKEFGTWADPPETFAQTSTTGKGRAIAGIRTDDMIVQARARATSALVAGGWFGVMARHIDDRNFYYLRLGDGRVSIRRYLNGSFVELAGVPFTVSSNVTYTLRLEAVGTSLRAYVNNQFMVEANDSSHAAGRYGLATNLTAARFDDVLVWQP
jgi:pectate lyase